MKLRFSLFTIVTGFGFLAASVFTFLHMAPGTKLGPSLVQGILGGFGMFWVHIALFLLVFAMVHGAVGWFFAWAVAPMTRRLAPDREQAGKLAFLLLLIALLWLILEAAQSFPHTSLGGSLGIHASGTIGVVVKWAALATWAGAFLGGLGLHVIAWGRQLPPRAAATTIALPAVGIVAVLASVGWVAQPNNAPFPEYEDQPHVILVGIDGWRLDTLTEHGGQPGLMPFVEEFFRHSAHIEEAVTPLARTFPAWWSVFTGQFPTTHGARFNLIADEFISSPLHLPQQLGEQGYYRVFAMDERRFANFREGHGFDKVVGPGMGAADFLIGRMHDAPLTNLLVNTTAGRYLFPFLHANRAAYSTYQPEQFDRMLAKAIARVPRQPLFLVTHFELPHWPFKWADGPTGEFLPHAKGEDYAHYQETLRLVDSQVAKLFSELEFHGILENAIVVMLSDHGEAFSEERLTWSNPGSGRQITTPAGHGNSVLGLTQHFIPLAFRRYGGEQLPARQVPGRASLVDIYPTLAQWLDLEMRQPLDGQSLLPALRNPDGMVTARPIPLETGFNTDSSMAGDLSQARLFEEGAAYYRVTRDGRLEIKPGDTQELVIEKQRAVLYGDEILVMWGSHTGSPLLGRISNLTFSELHETPLYRSTRHPLLQKFCTLFHNDQKHMTAPHCTVASPDQQLEAPSP